MRRFVLAAIPLMLIVAPVAAQPTPTTGVKQNADPCSDEVSAALKKLRNSSWFRMDSFMLTENGPTSMQVDYVLPDRMHQKVTVKLTDKTTEMILIGNDAWSRQGDGPWTPVPTAIATQLKAQMDESVLQEQTDIGKYTCKGRTKFEGRDVMSYKLEQEAEKGSTAAQSQAFRMFYVDALTGLPVSNALLVPGREDKPIFKTAYSFPLDLKIEAPKDVAAPAAASTPSTPSAAPATPAAPDAAPAPATPESK
ncbi:hypothetical protein DLM45_01115 [Hyphomicrobium methylovorum]|uniref:hypothetical protein n=1 Tax=Hyphomicrobium methylovorum TaxID=84 RepID=UPI0015E70FEE|nr:hypothetical protein [Hyphomicrobium methylovorum]MBA2124825.1 hypothetical protein [Hyphomicrobium methylovorum]